MRINQQRRSVIKEYMIDTLFEELRQPLSQSAVNLSRSEFIRKQNIAKSQFNEKIFSNNLLKRTLKSAQKSAKAFRNPNLVSDYLPTKLIEKNGKPLYRKMEKIYTPKKVQQKKISNLEKCMFESLQASIQIKSHPLTNLRSCSRQQRKNTKSRQAKQNPESEGLNLKECPNLFTSKLAESLLYIPTIQQKNKQLTCKSRGNVRSASSIRVKRVSLERFQNRRGSQMSLSEQNLKTNSDPISIVNSKILSAKKL